MRENADDDDAAVAAATAAPEGGGGEGRADALGAVDGAGTMASEMARAGAAAAATAAAAAAASAEAALGLARRRPSSHSVVSSSSSKDEEALCRVCRCGEEAGPLYYPCKCKGSIRFVHEDCLVQWLKISHKRSCELCLTEFEFKSVYHDNTPQRLSSLEVLIGTLQLSMGYIPLLIQAIAVAIIWAVIFPVFTDRIHWLSLARTRAEAWSVFTDWSVDVVLRQCVFGIIRSAWIVVAFLVLMVLQDLANEEDQVRDGEQRQHLDHRNIAQFADRVVERAVAAAADANELVGEIEAAGEENRLMELGNRILREHVGQNLNLRGLLNEGADDLRIIEDIGEGGEAADDARPDDVQDFPHAPDEAIAAAAAAADAAEVAAWQDDAHDFDADGVGEFAPVVAHDAPIRPAPADEDMAWDALIGLRGGTRGIRRGLYTMILVSLGNTGFLFFFQFVPLTVGLLMLEAVRQCQIRWGMTPGHGEGAEMPGHGYLLSLGYVGFVLLVVVYVFVLKLRDIWAGRSAVPGRGIVASYAISVLRGIGDMFVIALIMLLELLVLELLVGGIVHIGAMGVSGDVASVFWTRAELCGSSPKTCAFIHWAIGSVLIANWSAVIWAFRQIVHPRFKVRFFEGWYDATKNIEMGIFGPMIDRHRREIEEQNRLWQERIALVTSRIVSDQTDYAQTQGAEEVQDDDMFAECMDQAPVAGPDTGDVARLDLVSHTLEECLSYFITVVLWSFPAVLVLLMIPIHLIKVLAPSILPIRIGSFKQPFADAQLPLDMFLFHSLPYVIERLDLNRLLLQASRQVAVMLTYPLDLHGYVLKPMLQHMRSGFVYVDPAHGLRGAQREGPLQPATPGANANDCPAPGENGDGHEASKVAEATPGIHGEGDRGSGLRGSSRSAREKLPGAIRSLQLLSRNVPGSEVDFLGIVCHATAWTKFAPQVLRNAAPLQGGGGLDTDDKLPPLFLFSVTDVHGYCVPVFLSAEAQRAIQKVEGGVPDEDLLGKVLGLVDDMCALSDEVNADRVRAICARAMEGIVRDDEDLSRCPSKRVVRLLRGMREALQESPVLIDELVRLMPAGFGTKWAGGESVSTVLALRRIIAIWRDSNLAPVLAIRNARVSGENGRSLELDLNSQLLLEPDAGSKAELARICFQARHVENASTGQFCVLRHEPRLLTPRLRVLGIMAVLAAVLASFIALVLPLVAGRGAFALLGDPLKHDVYHWGGGFAILWFIFTLSRWFFTAVFGKDGGWRRALRLCFLWLRLGLKWCVALTVFGMILPVLAGSVFEFVVLDPIYVPVDRTPVGLVFQKWALGLAVLKAWTRLVLLGVLGGDVWADRLERVQYDGGYGINLRWTLLNVAVPMLDAILLRLCVPYVATCLLQHGLELDPVSAEATKRYSYPTFAVMLFLFDMAKALASYADILHDRVRDRRYMVGRQLQNR
ncbi:E3 ubiquitin-protein ligase MARCH6 [Hondaea fermentalgiana]|uniref:RING-type E3 ubiquitin transferase n=1 Tax=Hondaea fermentalgiana TaxID=2315210 RepID=A0A2R5FZC4_9STRA|nr:E3 ubiquitin-protein ligase MARCH6 [Hondaea fermentalgiana]|eukprot:GBG24106.1 E3 ubiquitin-protein ligase MARCH6 [Hondaea fermentalgiana]